MLRKKAQALLELVSPDGNVRHTMTAEDRPKTDDYAGPAEDGEVRFGCGHKGKAFYRLNLYGHGIYLNANDLEKRRMCAKCLTKLLVEKQIRCGICGSPIIHGKEVALYRDAAGFQPYATRIDWHETKCVVGCERCAPEGFVVGIWDAYDKTVIRLNTDIDQLAKLLAVRSMEAMGMLQPPGGMRGLPNDDPSPEKCAACPMRPFCPIAENGESAGAEGQPDHG
jgi:hypothetical protein